MNVTNCKDVKEHGWTMCIAESPRHQAVAQIHQHMDQSADQISQESSEGILRVRIDLHHQQMHVSECVGTLASSHVLEASSPV